MGCRYAGGVRSPEDLWRLVDEGSESLSDFPDDRGWDLAGLFDPDPDRPAPPTCGGAVSSRTRPSSTRVSSGFRRGRRWPWIRSSGCCWRSPGRRSNARASTRPRCAAPKPASSRAASSAEYALLLDNTDEDIEAHRVTGIANSVVSGRIAYTLGLEGPAVTVDTACSSSLVALHLAAQALRAGRLRAGTGRWRDRTGVPAMFADFSRQRGLAPDGRIKAFAKAADGTAWGEGAGLLLLERLSDAQRNGHTIHAVIRGTAVNQDGASNGLTAPNGPAQQRVIERALARRRSTTVRCGRG